MYLTLSGRNRVMEKKIELRKNITFIAMAILIVLAVISSVYLQFIKGNALTSLVDHKSFQDVFFNLSLLGFLIIVEITLTTFAYRAENKYIFITEQRVRNQVFEKVLKLPMSTYIKHNYSQYVNDITKKVDTVIQLYYASIPKAIWFVSRIVLVTISLFYIDYRLALLIITLMVLPVMVPKLLESKLKSLQERAVSSDSTILHFFNNYFRNLLTIKLASSEQTFKWKLSNNIKDNSTHRLDNSNIQTTARMLSMLLSYTIYFVTLVFSMYLIFSGRLSVGYLFTILGLEEQLTWPIVASSEVVRNIIASKKLRMEVLEESTNSKVLYNDLCVNQDDEIEFKNVSFGYNGTKNILEQFSYKFLPNKKYLITGKSGAGKSTLISLLLGIISPKEGEIIIGKQPYNTNMNLPKGFSVVQQSEELFQDTLLFNLTLGKKIDLEKINNVLSTLNLQHLSNEYNLETTNVDNNLKLSGGELRRLLLARALLQDSKVIILDEPLTGLDYENIKEVENSILSIENQIVIVISHIFTDSKLSQFDDIIKLS